MFNAVQSQRTARECELGEGRSPQWVGGAAYKKLGFCRPSIHRSRHYHKMREHKGGITHSQSKALGDSKQGNEGCGCRFNNPSCLRLWEAPPHQFPTESFQLLENTESFPISRLLLPGKEALHFPHKDVSNSEMWGGY